MPNFKSQLSHLSIDDIEKTLDDYDAFRPQAQMQRQKQWPSTTDKFIQGFYGPNKRQGQIQRFFNSDDL